MGNTKYYLRRHIHYRNGFALHYEWNFKDSCNSTALSLLDPIIAFDTVHHIVPLAELEMS